MVLILVLVVVAMLSLAGLSLVANMRTENQAAHLQGRRLQLEHVAGSAAELIKAFCQQSWADQQEAGGAWDNADRFRGVLVWEDDTSGRRARFDIVSPRAEDGQIAGVRYGLENESAKLHLGALLRWEAREPGAARRALLTLPGMTTSIADAILDWIDADSAPRPFGAEADYYRDMEAPYRPRNGVPQCLEELLLVRGVTRELMYGGASQRAGPIPARSGRASLGTLSGGAATLPWVSLLTVSSAERNETLDGRPRVHLNTDDLRALHQELSTRLDRSWADFIVVYRQYGPYRGSRSAEATAPNVDLSLPPKARIDALLDLVGAKVRLDAPGREAAPVVASPVAADPAAARESLARLLDVATVVSAPVIEGTVNVNLAPRAVLMAVPGMDASLVDRILVARGVQGAREDAQRRFPTWLWGEGLVDLEKMKALLPYLTGGGDVARAQVTAYYDRPGPTVRVELVIDAARTPPRQVYWKQLVAPAGLVPPAVELGARSVVE